MVGATMETMKILAVVAAMALVGCGSLEVDQSKVVPAPEGAEEAITATLAFYGVPDGHRPKVWWYGGAALNCAYGYGYTDSTGTCVGGDELDETIIVAVWDGALLHQTGLTHEVGHYASDHLGEGGDQDHVGRFFRDPGEDLRLHYDASHGLNGAAQLNLASMGM